jgi:hypothetical protein
MTASILRRPKANTTSIRCTPTPTLSITHKSFRFSLGAEFDGGESYAYAEDRLVRPTLIGRMAAATSLESGSLS